jgi:chaperonin cofactor prefoldin
MTRESVVSWWRQNSALTAFLSAQLVGAIVWGATLQSRVGVIEARGSPQLEALTIRINTLEQQNLAQERQLARLAAVDLFLSQMDTRLARFEERQSNVLKTLDDNAKRLDAINEGLQSHIRQWPGRPSDK